LPVTEVATDDAVLFLWSPMSKLAEALRVVEAWGFEHRSGMCWVKDQIGMGHYVRGQHELLLIARRGLPPHPAEADRPSSVVHAPRGRHSEKPQEFYALIERMYPELPKVELFARVRRDGWDAWGNEVARAEAAE
jgi:N6-adenosine-specific RNA methylase IME4